jgi:hypothetical protein
MRLLDTDHVFLEGAELVNIRIKMYMFGNLVLHLSILVECCCQWLKLVFVY